MIPTDLFSFAYVPAWFEQLYALSQLAIPEPWRFINPEYEIQNTETPILERYIHQVFKKLVIEYEYAQNPMEADGLLYLRNEFACLHTGLYTKQYKSIYMCFDRNKRQDTLKQWYFKGFVDEGSPWLKYISLLPLRPSFPMRQYASFFDPEWEIRVNADHILGDAENVQRLPESIRDAWNLPLLLETAVELARRRSLVDWSLAVPQSFQGRIQYLLPIHLTNMARPDLAMALSVMEGYYIGHTCLTLNMAYQNARLLARPTAEWLCDLVEPERSNDAQDHTLPSMQGKAVSPLL